MGTNFYTKIKECDNCGRYETVHLGKSSAGWQFSFQYNGGQFYKNVPEMKKWLFGRIIEDEYGKVISNEDFWEMVENKQNSENLNHAKEYPQKGVNFLIGNYSFSDTEFS